MPFLDRGGELFLRYNPHSMNLYEQDEQGQMVNIDWLSRLRHLPRQATRVPACLRHDYQRMRCLFT